MCQIGDGRRALSRPAGDDPEDQKKKRGWKRDERRGNMQLETRRPTQISRESRK
jgi:hypothetical protein